MRRRTLNGLTAAGFGLILLAFLVRAFGQLVLGPDRSLAVAGPIALLALALLGLVLARYALAVTGLLPLADAE